MEERLDPPAGNVAAVQEAAQGGIQRDSARGPRGRPPRTRILDAAEALFMEHGFEATSLRLITNAAGANLAAVNYHFGSKEELFQAVLTRRLDPMNQARVGAARPVRTLDGAPRRSAASASSLRCSFPALELARDPARGGANFLRLLGPRLRGSRALHPAVPVGAVRADDHALQGRVRAARCRTCRARSCRGACTSSWARCRTRWRAPMRSRSSPS